MQFVAVADKLWNTMYYLFILQTNYIILELNLHKIFLFF